MTRTKFPISFAFALIFACIVSCDEQGETLEAKSATSSKANSSVNPPAKRNGVTEFNGTEGNPLDLATAKRWTANFRETLENENEIQAHYFGSEIIQNILSQSNCVGIRVYYALDDNGEKKLLLVGVDSTGENLLPSANGKVGEGDDGKTVGDYSWPCPDYCPGNSL